MNATAARTIRLTLRSIKVSEDGRAVAFFSFNGDDVIRVGLGPAESVTLGRRVPAAIRKAFAADLDYHLDSLKDDSRADARHTFYEGRTR